jgi:hypothetical protein
VAVLDEIDSGLDIDALRDVADAVNGLKRPDSATLMVTHYKAMLLPTPWSLSSVSLRLALHLYGSNVVVFSLKEWVSLRLAALIWQ